MGEIRKTKVETSFQRAQILSELTTLFYQYPQYTFAQHLEHIFSTSPDWRKRYEWTDDELIKNIKLYINKLITETDG